jgi:hypothetical protein
MKKDKLCFFLALFSLVHLQLPFHADAGPRIRCEDCAKAHPGARQLRDRTAPLFSEFGLATYFGFLALYHCPFALDIKTALGWIFKRTTLRYEDARKLDEIYWMMYLTECRYVQDSDDDGRVRRLRQEGKTGQVLDKLGVPQTKFEKVTMGAILLAMFTAYIWGPMIIFSLVASVSSSRTNNVAGAQLSVDLLMQEGSLKLFETTFADYNPAREISCHTPSGGGTSTCESTETSPALSAYEAHAWGPAATQTPRESVLGAIQDDWQMFGGQVLLAHLR